MTVVLAILGLAIAAVYVLMVIVGDQRKPVTATLLTVTGLVEMLVWVSLAVLTIAGAS